MKITSVETFLVRNPKPARGGEMWLFVKLTTDDGIVGYGECNASFGRERTVIQMIQDYCEMYVIGADPFAVELLWETLYSGGSHYFRHPGMISTQALSGIEIACWDIIGKACNQPVYNLLGGKINPKLRSYTYLHTVFDDIHAKGEPEGMAEGALILKEQGFSAVKFDPCEPVNPAPRNMDIKELHFAERCVREVRKAVGDDFDIIIGTHGQLTTRSAILFGQMVEQYLPMWYEEPVPPENIEEMAYLADHVRIPIAAGERLISLYEFRPLLDRHAASIAQVHIGINGLLEAKKIAGMAQAHYAQIAPWMYNGPIAAAASVQLDACSPNFLIQEGVGKWDGLDKDIVKEYIEWKDGYIIVPDRPGIGVELNEEMVRKYAGTVQIQRFVNR